MPTLSRAVPVLVVAVFATAWAAPLIRLTTAPPLAIAAWRLTIASLVLGPLFAASGARLEWRAMTARDRRALVLAGVALACHFASWITSVRLTTVAASSVLVSLSPVFAWMLSRVFLGEQPTLRQSWGILLAVGGAVIIALGDTRAGASGALLGDALALVGALCGAIYFVIGRQLRSRLGLTAYVTPVYAVAALVLLGWAAARGEAFAPYAPRDWAIFAALAAGPMLIGHTGLNYALRHVPAWGVGAAALGDPIGAIVIAWFLPAIAERPGLVSLLGGACCLTGIVLTLASAPRLAPR
jgi:drug/metabolite transporter (DMT)-like permease